MSVPALEMNVLRPLITQPPSRRSARVRMPRASEPASGSVRPKAPRARPSANGRSHRSRCVVVAEEVERQRADGDVRLPGRGHGLVGQPDLLHGGDEADRRHADPAPLLGDQHAEQAELPHLAQQVGRAARLLPGGRRRAGRSRSVRSHGTARPGRARGSLREKSTSPILWTDRYKHPYTGSMPSDRVPHAFPQFDERGGRAPVPQAAAGRRVPPLRASSASARARPATSPRATPSAPTTSGSTRSV